MRIQGIRIDGYKNLSDVKISFDNITALVALNNFGKSNVLSGIDFGLAFIKASTDEKKEMMANTNLIPINKSMVGRNFRYEMEASTDINEDEYIVQYELEFAWKNNEEEDPYIISESLRIKQNEKGQKYTQLFYRSTTGATYKSSETGRCSSPLRVDNAELVVNKLKAFDDLYYAEIINQLNGMKIYMENSLDVKNCYLPDPIIRKGFENEMIEVRNLPRIIYNLKEQNPDKFELLKDVFTQLFPDIEDVVVNRIQISIPEDTNIADDIPFIFSDHIHVLYVKDRNLAKPIDIAAMSDGAKRVFMLLTKIIISSVSNISLIAIEEPENSVHPGLFQAYMRIISELLNDCKVIITSHSPYIISYLDPACIHVGMNRIGGVAEFFSFKKLGQRQLQTDAKTFGMSMGDYLFSLLSDADDSLSAYLECDE